MKNEKRMNNIPEDHNSYWMGLGNYIQTPKEVFFELLDNIISNFYTNNIQQKDIIINFKKRKDKIKISIEDSGSGIEDVEKSLTIGDITHQNTWNVFGRGLKHALAAANPKNDKWKIYTKNNKNTIEEYFLISAPYEISEDYIYYEVIEEKWPGDLTSSTGTYIEFYIDLEFFLEIRKEVTGKKTYAGAINVLAEEIGYTYAKNIDYLDLDIIFKIEHDNEEKIIEKKILPIKPKWENVLEDNYYNEKISIEDKINLLNVNNKEVTLNYRYGIIRDSKDNFKYYKNNKSCSGVEVSINGRVFDNNIFKEVWNIESHNKYNRFLFQVDIISNDLESLPEITTSKDGIKAGKERLFKWIRKKLSVPIVTNKVETEKKLKNKLKDKIKDIYKNPYIRQEVSPFENIANIKMDMFISFGKEAPSIIIECKKNDSSIRDVMQLILYYDGCCLNRNLTNPREAILISSYHSKSVKELVKEANNNMYNSIKENYNIKLKEWHDYDIKYPLDFHC